MGYRLNRLTEPVFISVCQNFCLLSLAFIIDWRVVCSFDNRYEYFKPDDKMKNFGNIKKIV